MFVPRDSRPIIFIMGQHLYQLIATFLVYVGHTCVFSLSFLCIEFNSFFSKKPSHILLLRYTLSLGSETKRKLLHLLYGKTPFPSLMIDFAFIKKKTPSVLFFFARLGDFLESSGGCRPHIGLFVPRDCGAFRHVLLSLYPLILHSLIVHHLEMNAIEYRDSDVRSSEIETCLSSSGESTDKDFEIVMSKPPSSSKPFSSSKTSLSSIPFHALSESCFLELRHLKSIRKRFQFPEGVVIRLPHPNEKACTFARGEMSFYEATFSCGLRFPIHPFIMQLLSVLNIAPGQLVPNAWRMIIGCMLIWVSFHDGDMITLNEFLYLYHLKPPTHYGYLELLPWNRESKIVHSFPTSFHD